MPRGLNLVADDDDDNYFILFCFRSTCMFCITLCTPSVIREVLSFWSKVSKVKQSRYTPWRRLGGEEV
jgi:hypothetical protein